VTWQGEATSHNKSNGIQAHPERRSNTPLLPLEYNVWEMAINLLLMSSVARGLAHCIYHQMKSLLFRKHLLQSSVVYTMQNPGIQRAIDVQDPNAPYTPFQYRSPRIISLAEDFLHLPVCQHSAFLEPGRIRIRIHLR